MLEVLSPQLLDSGFQLEIDGMETDGTDTEGIERVKDSEQEVDFPVPSQLETDGMETDGVETETDGVDTETAGTEDAANGCERVKDSEQEVDFPLSPQVDELWPQLLAESVDLEPLQSLDWLQLSLGRESVGRSTEMPRESEADDAWAMSTTARPVALESVDGAIANGVYYYYRALNECFGVVTLRL